MQTKLTLTSTIAKVICNMGFFMLVSFLTACTVESVPINYGQDQCEFCKMTIMDRNYGAELLSAKGKAIFFDSPECLIRFVHGPKADKWKNARRLVTPFESEAGLIDVAHCTYLKSESLRSPMGANITAFKTKEEAKSRMKLAEDQLLSWEEVESIVLR